MSFGTACFTFIIPKMEKNSWAPVLIRDLSPTSQSWRNDQKGSRNMRQQTWSGVDQCNTGPKERLSLHTSTVPLWKETLVCRSGFPGFCGSMLESLASEISVSQRVRNQEASVPVVVVGITKLRSPGWHQVESNSCWYWNLCLMHSWPTESLAHLQPGQRASVAAGHMLPPAGLCQAEAHPQIPHLMSSEEQET